MAMFEGMQNLKNQAEEAKESKESGEETSTDDLNSAKKDFESAYDYASDKLQFEMDNAQTDGQKKLVESFQDELSEMESPGWTVINSMDNVDDLRKVSFKTAAEEIDNLMAEYGNKSEQQKAVESLNPDLVTKEKVAESEKAFTDRLKTLKDKLTPYLKGDIRERSAAEQAKADLDYTADIKNIAGANDTFQQQYDSYQNALKKLNEIDDKFEEDLNMYAGTEQEQEGDQA